MPIRERFHVLLQARLNSHDAPPQTFNAFRAQRLIRPLHDNERSLPIIAAVEAGQNMAAGESAERAAGRVDHPNVVRVYDAGIDAGSPFVVTELVPGRPLSP